MWPFIKNKQRLLQQKKDLIVLKARLEKENLQKSFSRAEKNLNKILTERQAEVKSLYGDLVVADEQYGGARGRRWRVEWTKSPQPIQIKLNCIRGLKDKVPVGRYAIMVRICYFRTKSNIVRNRPQSLTSGRLS